MKISRIAMTTVLLASLAATPAMAFTVPDGSELSEAIADQFVRPMLHPEGTGAEKVSDRFEWTNLDIDDDGYDELFIKLAGGELCGETGCPIVGFMRNDEDFWDVVLTTIGDRIDIEGGTVVVQDRQGRKEWRYDSDFRGLVPVKD